MSLTAHFAAYAAAFEKAYVSDDWPLVEPFFTEETVYEVALDPPMGGCFEGRAAIPAARGRFPYHSLLQVAL